MTLNLVGGVLFPTPDGRGMRHSGWQITFRGLVVAIPVYSYDDTGVVAQPASEATLIDGVLSIDLTSWVLRDFARNRLLTERRFATSDPSSDPVMVDLVERYLREARGLTTQRLQVWAQRVLAEHR